MRSEEQLKEMIHECWDSLEVKKCISRGNFGVVFRCTGGGKAYARDLAVKVVERDFGEDDRINAEDAGLSFDEYFQKKENAARQASEDNWDAPAQEEVQAPRGRKAGKDKGVQIDMIDL